MDHDTIDELMRREVYFKEQMKLLHEKKEWLLNILESVGHSNIRSMRVEPARDPRNKPDLINPPRRTSNGAGDSVHQVRRSSKASERVSASEGIKMSKERVFKMEMESKLLSEALRAKITELVADEPMQELVKGGDPYNFINTYRRKLEYMKVTRTPRKPIVSKIAGTAPKVHLSPVGSVPESVREYESDFDQKSTSHSMSERSTNDSKAGPKATKDLLPSLPNSTEVKSPENSLRQSDVPSDHESGDASIKRGSTSTTAKDDKVFPSGDSPQPIAAHSGDVLQTAEDFEQRNLPKLVDVQILPVTPVMPLLLPMSPISKLVSPSSASRFSPTSSPGSPLLSGRPWQMQSPKLIRAFDTTEHPDSEVTIPLLEFGMPPISLVPAVSIPPVVSPQLAVPTSPKVSRRSGDNTDWSAEHKESKTSSTSSTLSEKDSLPSRDALDALEVDNDAESVSSKCTSADTLHSVPSIHSSKESGKGEVFFEFDLTTANGLDLPASSPSEEDESIPEIVDDDDMGQKSVVEVEEERDLIGFSPDKPKAPPAVVEAEESILQQPATGVDLPNEKDADEIVEDVEDTASDSSSTLESIKTEPILESTTVSQTAAAEAENSTAKSELSLRSVKTENVPESTSKSATTASGSSSPEEVTQKFSDSETEVAQEKSDSPTANMQSSLQEMTVDFEVPEKPEGDEMNVSLSARSDTGEKVLAPSPRQAQKEFERQLEEERGGVPVNLPEVHRQVDAVLPTDPADDWSNEANAFGDFINNVPPPPASSRKAPVVARQDKVDQMRPHMEAVASYVHNVIQAGSLTNFEDVTFPVMGVLQRGKGVGISDDLSDIDVDRQRMIFDMIIEICREEYRLTKSNASAFIRKKLVFPADPQVFLSKIIPAMEGSLARMVMVDSSVVQFGQHRMDEDEMEQGVISQVAFKAFAKSEQEFCDYEEAANMLSSMISDRIESDLEEEAALKLARLTGKSSADTRDLVSSL